MKQDSLDTAISVIIDALNESDIETIDKLELMLNIRELLKNYEENIKILSKRK